MDTIYCTKCGEALTLHADSSIACSCAFLDGLDYKVPEQWPVGSLVIEDWRMAELAVE